MCRLLLSGGPFAWRDSQKPTQLLESLAEIYEWDKPLFADSEATGDQQLHVAGRTYRLSQLSEVDGGHGAGLKGHRGRPYHRRVY